jgi:hypothetical protein
MPSPESDIKAVAAFLMLPSFTVTPFMLMAAYNFHLATVEQRDPMAQQMLAITSLIIGVITVAGLIGFLTSMFSKEIANIGNEEMKKV